MNQTRQKGNTGDYHVVSYGEQTVGRTGRVDGAVLSRTVTARRGLVRGLAVECVGPLVGPMPGCVQSAEVNTTHDIVDNSGLAAFSGLVNT